MVNMEPFCTLRLSKEAHETNVLENIRTCIWRGDCPLTLVDV